MKALHHARARARTVVAAAAGLFAVAALACHGGARGTTAGNAARGAPRTTSGAIYMRNLDGEIGTAEARTQVLPSNAAVARQLSALIYLRARIYGDLDGIQRAIGIAHHASELAPNDGATFVMLAEQEQSLHRFADARRDLQHAGELGTKRDLMRADEVNLDWEEGHYDVALPALRAGGAKTSGEVARRAQLDHDLGQFDEADGLFAESEALLTDTNPLPAATSELHRGLNLFDAGRYEEAAASFRRALQRVPMYTAAKDHLAETLHLLGRDDEAIPLYEELVRDSSDPEFKGALAALYHAHGREEEARALDQSATAGYEAALAKYPDAMYWHASEFFLGEGHDAAKALELLRANYTIRPNAVSLVALARAELAAGSLEGAKDAIERALAAPVVSARLYWTAARVYARLGNRRESREYVSRAKGLNPRVADVEPALDSGTGRAG